MMTTDELLASYRAFREVFEADTAWDADLLSYTQYRIPSEQGAGGDWFLYHSHASDFVREMLNTINQFRMHAARLAAWAAVLEGRPDQERLDLMIEFVNTLANAALDAPYKIKNRLVYAASNLCDTANAATGEHLPAILPPDQSIGFGTLQAVGAPWSKVGELCTALGLLNGNEFREATGNFRNTEHHRFARAIELGFPITLMRLPSEPGTRRFAIGGPEPLTLATLVPVLQIEHQRSVVAFQSFWELIQEHLPIFPGNLTSP